jgi:hypothetical protein
LEFTVNADGSVSASLHGHFAPEGFQGFLHGGMITSLLDGEMTNCLPALALWTAFLGRCFSCAVSTRLSFQMY